MTQILEQVDVRRPAAATGLAPLRGRAGDVVVWLAFAVFVAAQVLRILGQAVGPSLDEGIYLTSGLRTLEGEGVADGYLTWFAGSLAWPVLGALGHLAGGLAGARLVALLLVSVGLLSALAATANLYGQRARAWAALFVFGWGAVLGVSRIAEYDAVAIAGVGLCAWALTQFARRDHRLWLVAAAVALFVAVIGKYAAAFTLPAMVGLLLNTRGRRRWADLLIFLLILGALLLAFFLPFRDQLALFPEWRVRNNPSFGATTGTIAFTLAANLAVPALLAFAGLLLTWRWDRRVALPLFSSVLLFPAYHFFAGNTVGANKHAVIGMLLALPLVGVALDRATRHWAGAAVAGLLLGAFAAGGWWQAQLAERSWPDVRPTVAYLHEQVEPGDLVANNGAWPYTLGLYADGDVARLTDLSDGYAVANGLAPDPCAFDWFVDQRGQNDWPEDVRARFAACGTFELVQSATDEVTNLGADLRYLTYGVQVDVWHNREPR